MSYEPKYCKYTLKHPIEGRGKSVAGPKPNPENWTDAALMSRDIHHGYLKHRAQARFRGEDYSLTREQWEKLWTEERWLCRGRGKHDLCLAQIDPEKGWHNNNVELVERMEVLRRNKEYRKNNYD